LKNKERKEKERKKERDKMRRRAWTRMNTKVRNGKRKISTHKGNQTRNESKVLTQPAIITTEKFRLKEFVVEQGV
jgi:hypothetical protein